MVDLENEVPLDQSTRESVSDDVRAAFELHSKDLGDKLADMPAADETATEKADRLRNERGQFVAKDQVEQPAGAPDPKITDADPSVDKQAQPSTAPVSIPTSWSADAKAEWSKLSPAVQQAVLKRETEINEGGRQWSEEKQRYETALAPVAELSRQNGITTEDGLQRLLTVEYRLKADGPRMIAELANAYGVDLAALVNGTQQPFPQPQAIQQFDPNTIPQIVNQAIAEREQQGRLSQTIEQFSTAKDQTGQPLHPHFEALKARMALLLKNEEANDLQDAYDQASWSNPDIRAQLQQAATPQAVQRTQVARSRAAAITPKGAPRGAPPVSRSGSAGSVIDDVRAAFEQHAAG